MYTVSPKFLSVRKKISSAICPPNEGLLLVSVTNLRSSPVRTYISHHYELMFLIPTNLHSSSIRTYVPHPYELMFLTRTNLCSSPVERQVPHLYELEFFTSAILSSSPDELTPSFGGQNSRGTFVSHVNEHNLLLGA